MRVDGPKSADGDNFFSASIGAISGDDGQGIGELAISSDGHVYGYSGNDLVPTFLTSAPVTLGKWHYLAVEVDFAARAFSFFLDEEDLGTCPWDEDIESNLLQRGSILTYAAPDAKTRKKQNYVARFDSFAINVVDE